MKIVKIEYKVKCRIIYLNHNNVNYINHHFHNDNKLHWLYETNDIFDVITCESTKKHLSILLSKHLIEYKLKRILKDEI